MISTTFGKLTIDNTHPLAHHESGFKMSPLLLEKVGYVGQLNVYEKSAEVLDFLIGYKTSSVQVNKVVNYYGIACAKDNHLLQPVIKNIGVAEKVYLMLDGSMVFTKEEGWKEVKVARLFKEKDCKQVEGKPNYIRHSQYLAQLTDSKTFTEQLDILVDKYKLQPEQLIFVSDGAPWIKNYAADAYEKATSILDYYHASEYLHQFKNEVFLDKEIAKKWADEQCQLLMQSEVKKVIENVEKIALETECKKAATAIINYYTSNLDRMDYKTYKTMGVGIIGSGAIESAHRTLIQSRCKQSGQVWSKKGLQNMLNVRTTYQNNDLKKIRTISIKQAA